MAINILEDHFGTFLFGFFFIFGRINFLNIFPSDVEAKVKKIKYVHEGPQLQFQLLQCADSEANSKAKLNQGLRF